MTKEEEKKDKMQTLGNCSEAGINAAHNPQPANCHFYT